MKPFAVKQRRIKHASGLGVLVDLSKKSNQFKQLMEKADSVTVLALTPDTADPQQLCNTSKVSGLVCCCYYNANLCQTDGHTTAAVLVSKIYIPHRLIDIDSSKDL